MSREANIDQILKDLTKSGSQIEYLKELRKKSLDLVSKDYDLDEVLSHIAKETKEQTEIFLNQKNELNDYAIQLEDTINELMCEIRALKEENVLLNNILKERGLPF